MCVRLAILSSVYSSVLLVVSTSAIDCLQRLVSKMTCYVSSETLNTYGMLSLNVVAQRRAFDVFSGVCLFVCQHDNF